MSFSLHIWQVLTSSQSSPSIKRIYSPVEFINPVFLAATTPSFFLFINFTLLSFFITLFILSRVPSVEPSFTITISISVNV